MRFDQPIGTLTQRNAATAYAGGWFDATGFGQYYTATGGAFHTGNDLNLLSYADVFASVYAPADGRVVFAGTASGWQRKLVCINHGSGIWSRSAHLDNVIVAAGEFIHRGDAIGKIGDYNNDGAPSDHLHFDIAKIDLGRKPGDWPGMDLARLKQDYVDPKLWINSHRIEDGEFVAEQWTPTDNSGTRVRFTPDVTVVDNIAGVLPFGAIAEGAKTGDGKWVKIVVTPESLTVGGTALIRSAVNTFAAYASATYMKQAVPVVPTPPPRSSFKLGVSVLIAHHLAQQAYDAGNRTLLFMEGLLAALQFKQGHPDCTVMYRKYIRTSGIPPADLFRGEAYIGHGVVFVTPLNECDSQCYGSVGEIESRAKFDNEVADMCQGRGTIYAAGGFSVGTPDFTKPEICDAMKRFYAPGYNAGKYAMNMHLYSPTMNHIYDGVQSISGTSTIRPAAKRDDGVQEYIVGRDNHIATVDVSATTRAVDPVGGRIWYERRWQFLFERCGFDPNPALLGIYCDETGVDEGGVGGFPAHGASAADVARWSLEFAALSKLPLVVNGVSYPSPMRGAAVFQAGDTQNWAGYQIQPYMAEIGRANA